ncbi:MAG: hypothetical protein COA79_16755 [Planctomycetota bacterium]|nr:MAG: hypothetical protein COA79_16755 [Planctomycetota bacterium]
MGYLNRFLLILSYGMFLFGLVSFLWPLNIFNQPKDKLNIILLDVSESMNLNSRYLQSKLNHFETLKDSKDFILGGYFSESIGFASDDVKNMTSLDVIDYIKSILVGGSKWRNPLGNKRTNFETAIIECIDEWGDKFQLNICILSDGKQNDGNLKHVIKKLTKSKHQLQFISFDEVPEDIYVKSVNSSEFFEIGESLQLNVEMLSTINSTRAPVQILINDILFKEIIVSISKGSNLFTFPLVINNVGNHKISVRCVVEDSFKNNNSKSILLKSKNLEKILLVSKNNFNIGLPNAELISPLNFPRSLKELIAFQSVVLNNVSWSDFIDKGKVQALKEFINNGGKLFVAGGNESFGFGDYMGTELESLLPVKVNPSGLISILFGVDNSGSMEDDIHGVRKIDIAVNSLLDIVQILEDEDEVGVHLYNKNNLSNNLWLPLQKVNSFSKALNKQIKKIPSPSGGTFILPALETLVSKILLSDKELKLIVLITDGESKETGFKKILKEIVDSKPSIGFVLIGADVNQSSILLKDCKEIFGLNWNMININEHGWVNLKDCFKEALHSITSGFSEKGSFDIFINKYHPFMKNMKVFKQSFSGRILKTGLKEGASSLVDINDKYPLVAHWYFGKGEVMSFQSGYFENWADKWLMSSQGREYGEFLNSWLNKRNAIASKIKIVNIDGGLRILFICNNKNVSSQTEFLLEIDSNKIFLSRSDENIWSVEIKNNNKLEKLFFKSNKHYKVFLKKNKKFELFNEGLFSRIPEKEMEDIYISNKRLFNIPGAISMEESKNKYVNFKLNDMKKTFNESLFVWLILLSFIGIILFRGRIH